MGGPVCRMAQRDDQNFETTPLQGKDLLGDEGFGESRIAFEDKGDPASRFGRSSQLRSRSAPAPQSNQAARGLASSGPGG